jgi:hypothetical protein
MTITKTMSIRTDRDIYEYFNEISKAERTDLSKAVRDLVTLGRVRCRKQERRKRTISKGYETSQTRIYFPYCL